MVKRNYMPMQALEVVHKVLEGGVEKHGAFGWLKRIETPAGRREELAAIERHIKKLKSGRTLDKDSGLPHAAHIAARALFLVEAARTVK